MKILMASFQCESNTFCDTVARTEDFEVFYSGSALEKCYAAQVFAAAGVTLEPVLYASALPCGMVSRSAFDHFCAEIVEGMEKRLPADGIYLYLHGSMYVEGLGSGEEALLKAIRAVTGPKPPISVALDFHATLSPGFIELVNAVEGFRTAPHTDHDDTERRAAEALLHCIRSGKAPRPAAVHLPYLCGDAALTRLEPFVRVNRMLEEWDGNPEVISCALFNGQPWYDAPYAGACAVVSGENARERALQLANAFWTGKDLLRLEGAITTDEAVQASLAQRDGIMFVNDSGDNTTAGASGEGTLLLRHYLEAGAENGLICGIYAPDATQQLLEQPQGATFPVVLCPSLSEPQRIETRLSVQVKHKGAVYGWAGDEVGRGVLARCGGLDLVLTDARAAFTTPEHFRRMGVDPAAYRAIVLKMGYLFPKLREISDSALFVLTPGQSSNDFASLPYKRLSRPMWPIHRDIRWQDIQRDAERSDYL